MKCVVWVDVDLVEGLGIEFQYVGIVVIGYDFVEFYLLVWCQVMDWVVGKIWLDIYFLWCVDIYMNIVGVQCIGENCQDFVFFFVVGVGFQKIDWIVDFGKCQCWWDFVVFQDDLYLIDVVGQCCFLYLCMYVCDWFW